MYWKYCYDFVLDDETSFSWCYVVIGILGILLAVSIAFIVFLKRQTASSQCDEESFKSKSKSRGQKRAHKYDNLTGLKENHQYESVNCETNNSHYK